MRCQPVFRPGLSSFMPLADCGGVDAAAAQRKSSQGSFVGAASGRPLAGLPGRRVWAGGATPPLRGGALRRTFAGCAEAAALSFRQRFALPPPSRGRQGLFCGTDRFSSCVFSEFMNKAPQGRPWAARQLELPERRVWAGSASPPLRKEIELILSRSVCNGVVCCVSRFFGPDCLAS